eukprot:653826_1
MSLLRNATWTLSNLCRGKPQPDFNKVLPCLHTLAILLFVKDRDVLTDACWALSYLSDDAGQSNPKIQAVVQSGAIGRLVQLLSSSSEIASTNIKVPALRCIGNIVTGDDAQTQAVLDAGVLEALAELIHHEKKSIRKEAFWRFRILRPETRTRLVRSSSTHCSSISSAFSGRTISTSKRRPPGPSA